MQYSTCLLTFQMTQKDIAFVADFLSEHFSEVSWEDRCFLVCVCVRRPDSLSHSLFLFDRTKSCLTGKGSTSM